MTFEASGLDLDKYFNCSDIYATRPKYVSKPSMFNSQPSLEDLDKYKEKLADFEQYKKDDAAWLIKNQEEIDRRSAEFIFYFYEYVGIPLDHPKANTLLSKCWEEGHSSGYSEVLNVGLDLVELVL